MSNNYKCLDCGGEVSDPDPDRGFHLHCLKCGRVYYEHGHGNSPFRGIGYCGAPDGHFYSLAKA